MITGLSKTRNCSGSEIKWKREYTPPAAIVALRLTTEAKANGTMRPSAATRSMNEFYSGGEERLSTTVPFERFPYDGRRCSVAAVVLAVGDVVAEPLQLRHELA